MTKKRLSILLSIVLVFSILPIPRASADDITGITLEKEMRAMIEKGIISGYGNGKYAPNEKVNRGQFATFISRALHLPNGKHRFTDVPRNSKLAPGINAAVDAGIISGYSATTFKPTELITREQMSLMIDKSLDYLKVAKKKGNLNFTDEKQITSSQSRLAISYMVGLKIIAGFPSENGLSFKPKQQATRAQAAAFISRMLDAAPKRLPYSIGTLDAKGNVTMSTTSYKTFSEAAKAISNESTQVILKDHKIIKMKNGIVVSKPGPGNATTTIYDADLKRIYTPISADNELEYIVSDDSKITVKIAGKTGYVKHEDAELIPSQAMKGRSYYSVNSAGDLVHHIYNHRTNKSISYVYGKAPSTFKQGVKYISWDGSTFRTENGTSMGTYHQYFNMLPVRTYTKYSASELDKIINSRLAEKEELYKKNPSAYARYKDATKKSKLKGLGAIVKDVEKNHKINALLILGWAIHESDYGMSVHAQTMNNLFGIKVYDSNPENGEKFNTVRDCVISLASNYVNKNYVPVNGAYANGGMPGNKSRGMNVRYASDPYWGHKIAGHLYQLDKELGGKDFYKNSTPYKIFEITGSGVNVRSTPGVTETNKIYTYSRAGFPVAVLETTADKEWYKIYSDDRNNLYGYVSTKYTKQLPIAK